MTVPPNDLPAARGRIDAEDLAAVLNALQLFVALLDSDGVIVWTNRAAVELTGSPGGLTGTRLVDGPWWSPVAAQQLADALARAAAGEAVRAQTDLHGPGGRSLRLDLSLRGLPREPGRPAWTLVKGIDITDVSQRDREAATYRAVVDTHTDIISRLAPDGTLRFVNDAYCRFFGRSRAALLGRSWQPVAHPDDIALVQRELARMTPSEPIVVVENRVFDGEGRLRWMEFLNRGFYDPDGTLVEFQSIGRDITLRKEGEVERLRAERRMQERQRIEGLGLLAGGVAHDINNVLTCVLSSVALARRSADDPAEVAALLDEIDHAAGRVADLCRQMLAYAGKGPLLRDLVDLTRLITTSLPLLRATLPSTATLDLRLAPGLPPILGDETQLRQIALNLVANAGDAVRGRGGVIVVSLRSARVTRGSPEADGLDVDLPEGPVVVLRVADDGLGMPPEVVARIFEPFFTTKTVGRGLGLAATLGLVRAHQAAIRVDSTPGAGTCFEVVFPAAGPRAPLTPPEPAPTSPPGRDLVLLVDDDDAVRQILARQIVALGYAVLEARGGREAVTTFARRGAEIGVVLLDVTMPDMNGDRVLRELQRVRPDLPALVMSGYVADDIHDLFAGTRVTQFLHKPFSLATLQAALLAAAGAPEPRPR